MIELIIPAEVKEDEDNIILTLDFSKEVEVIEE